MIADDLSRIAMSPSLGSALARAGELARRQGHGEVMLEHMLLSLCEDPDARLVLAASNIDGIRLKTEVTAFLSSLPQRGGPGQGGEPGVSLDLRRILEAAAAAARGGRRREINGAIVLAAIVGDGRSPAAQMLQAQGLTFEGAIRALQHGTAVAARVPASNTEDILASARERVLSRTRHVARKSESTHAPEPEEPAAEFGFEKAKQPSVNYDDVPPTAPPDADVAAAPGPDEAPEVMAAPQAVEVEQEPVPVRPEPRSAPPPPAPLAQSPSEPAPMPPPIPGSHPQSPSRAPPTTSDSAVLASPSQTRFRAPSTTSDSATLASPSAPPFRTQPSIFDRPAPPSSPSPVLPPPIPQPVRIGGGGPPVRVGAAEPAPPGGLWREEPRRPQGVGSASSGPSAFERAYRTLQAPPGGMPAPPAARPVPAQRAEIGQLVENIPRTMRVAVPALVEVRIAKAEVKALAEGLQGGGAAYQHEVTITKAMSVRLRAPDGGFYIETASPETQWIERSMLLSSDDYASWRWHVTPRDRGKKRLQLIISARTVGADGLAAETALPDQVITVRVKTNYAKTASHWVGWGVAALIGGLLAKFGEGLLDAGMQVVKLTAG